MGEGAVIVRAGVGHVLGALGLELGDIPAVDSYAVCMVIRAAKDPSVFTITEKARTSLKCLLAFSHLRHYEDTMLNWC